MLKLFLLFCVSIFVTLTAGAYAATADNIVAVVNDQIITLSELNARTKLASRAMGVDLSNPLAERSLQRRTLGEMVDESLQQQYALTEGLQLTKAEFQAAQDQAIAGVGQAQWSKLTQGLGAAPEGKIRAEATWARLMNIDVAPRVQMGTVEIDRLIEEMSKTQNRTKKNLSLIFIPHAAEAVSGTSTTDAAARVLQLRMEAVAENANEATFATLAKTNSAAPSAAQGGSLGWLTGAEIPNGVAQAIQGLGAGEVSQPLRTPEGWLLVRVNDIRTDDEAMNLAPQTEYKLYLLAAEKPSSTEALKPLVSQLQAVTKAYTEEAAVQGLFAISATQVQFNRSSALGWVPATALQPEVAEVVRQTKLGNWSKPLMAPSQISRMFVAATRQVMPQALLKLRERVGQSLRANRTELEARRFMRELRQRAFVDIRL